MPRAAIVAVAITSGCVQVGPKDFPFGSAQGKPFGSGSREQSRTAQGQPAPSQPCPAPSVPPPIPEVAHIAIDPGKPVETDEGGESLLRAYIAQREWARRGQP